MRNLKIILTLCFIGTFTGSYGIDEDTFICIKQLDIDIDIDTKKFEKPFENFDVRVVGDSSFYRFRRHLKWKQNLLEENSNSWMELWDLTNDQKHRFLACILMRKNYPELSTVHEILSSRLTFNGRIPVAPEVREKMEECKDKEDGHEYLNCVNLFSELFTHYCIN